MGKATQAQWLDSERLLWTVGEREVPLSAEATNALMQQLRLTAPDLVARLEEQRP